MDGAESRTGSELAAVERDWRRRVRFQGGTKTFYDRWLEGVLKRVRAHEPLRPRDATRLRQLLERRATGRFVDPVKRLETSPRVISEAGLWPLVTSQGTLSCLEWRGIPLLKSVFDLGLYTSLLQELKPRTVVEIGSGLGGSALWLADMLEALEVDATVQSLDLRPPTTIERRRVRFRAGDCNAIEKALPLEQMSSWPAPWLVIEDAHVNVGGVLRHLDRAMRPGDYLVVEDSRSKRAELLGFVSSSRRYLLDTRYSDFFGRNVTSAADSIFRCV